MTRSQRAVRWLQPGLVVKRWMLTSGLGLLMAHTAAPSRAISSPNPEVSIQRFTTRPGCSQRTARWDRVIRSRRRCARSALASRLRFGVTGAKAGGSGR